MNVASMSFPAGVEEHYLSLLGSVLLIPSTAEILITTNETNKTMKVITYRIAPVILVISVLLAQQAHGSEPVSSLNANQSKSRPGTSISEATSQTYNSSENPMTTAELYTAFHSDEKSLKGKVVWVKGTASDIRKLGGKKAHTDRYWGKKKMTGVALTLESGSSDIYDFINIWCHFANPAALNGIEDGQEIILSGRLSSYGDEDMAEPIITLHNCTLATE